jgi:hypothetical protein
MRSLTNRIRIGVAIGLLLLLSTACTPAQIRLWGDHLGAPVTQPEAEYLSGAWASRDCLPAYSASTEVECAITDAHHRLGVGRVMSVDRFAALAYCESKLNPNAQNSRSTASGLFQFLDSTAASVFPKVGYGATRADQYHPVKNAQAAAWLMVNVGPSQWVCRS